MTTIIIVVEVTDVSKDIIKDLWGGLCPPFFMKIKIGF